MANAAQMENSPTRKPLNRTLTDAELTHMAMLGSTGNEDGGREQAAEILKEKRRASHQDMLEREAAKAAIKPARGWMVVHGADFVTVSKEMARFRHLFVKCVAQALDVPSGILTVVDVTPGSVVVEFLVHPSARAGDTRNATQLLIALAEQLINSNSTLRRGHFGAYAASAELLVGETRRKAVHALSIADGVICCDQSVQCCSPQAVLDEVLARLRIEQRRAESAEEKYKQAVIELRRRDESVKSLTKLLDLAKQQEEEKKEEQRDLEMQEFGKQLLHLEELAKLRALDVKEDLRDQEVIEFKQELSTLEEQQRSIAIGMTGVEIESDWIEGTPGLSIVTPDGLVSVTGVIHELETEAFERDQKGLTEMPAGRATSLCQGKAQDSTRMLVQAPVCNRASQPSSPSGLANADLRFVQVWNIPPDVLKKPLQWCFSSDFNQFVKKAGGSSADMAPVGAQLVMVKSPTANADVQTAVLEAKSIPQAEALVSAIEKWKVGIPKMKAKVISEEDFENLLEKSTTCVVFVKNVPEDIEDETDIKNMGKDIERAQIGHHPQHGRYAIIQARSHGAARSCVDVFNIPHSGGVMTAELMTVYQQDGAEGQFSKRIQKAKWATLEESPAIMAGVQDSGCRRVFGAFPKVLRFCGPRIGMFPVRAPCLETSSFVLMRLYGRDALLDVDATEALGAALAHEAQKGDVFFLRGELGSGKTSMARGFLRAFFASPDLDVPSPSYLLHFTYGTSGATSQNAGNSDGPSLVPGCAVHHIDPYRLPAGKIASLIDFEAIWQAICLVEWPERLGDQLVTKDGPQRLEIGFEGFGPQAEGRKVLLTAVGPRWQKALRRWHAEGGPLRSRSSEPPSHEIRESIGAALPAPLSAVAPSASSSSRSRNCRTLADDKKHWLVLGIESSCDDTGAAVLRGDGQILGEALASQAGIHEQWGGVVPRLAQEGHKQAIDGTVEEALQRAGVAASDISAVAVTVGPGLGLCLEVGVRKALHIAAAHRLPLVRVHHMEAHMMVTRLPPLAQGQGLQADLVQPEFPFITLLVSGGHNMAVLTRGVGRHTILGSTIDDSIGEAFDKTARLLGITKVPGGPHLERLAKDGDPKAHALPKPLAKTRDKVLQEGCNYSFSGLKTAVRTLVERELPSAKADTLSEEELHKAKADVAAAFQQMAVHHLCERASRAAGWALELEPDTKCLVVAGGVAANQAVRKGLEEVAREHSLQMFCPPPRLCVDNGVMVAWAGIERLLLGLFEEPPSVDSADSHVEIRPRWPLGERDPRSQQQRVPKGQKRKTPAAELSKSANEAEAKLRCVASPDKAAE
ncbi:GCP1 [Symbiodinium sp. KB8]|nr:GCP1 [Symbiodinium sp. KB8]